ncbi:phage virion morphogenesis protein [Acinetobacter guillouiae]|uniref:phage virion morphogenesis protein n=1 Tax=Acinetobacter guillouiae TaxID=106649 RepID=UPI0028D51451|nr:phage virion morphogenesis protein [Acinetobacter guillouiae]
MNEFAKLPAYTNDILQKMSPGERAKLSKNIGRDLRNSQKQRITSQKNSDGSSYIPRKKRLRERMKGKVRNKMFNKIKSLTYLKVMTDANAINIGFAGRIARIARVHQYGLRDRPDKKSSTIQYPKRELLGLTEQDITNIASLLEKHLIN